MASAMPLSDEPGQAATFSRSSISRLRSTAFTVSWDDPPGLMLHWASVEAPSNRYVTPARVTSTTSLLRGTVRGSRMLVHSPSAPASTVATTTAASAASAASSIWHSTREEMASGPMSRPATWRVSEDSGIGQLDDLAGLLHLGCVRPGVGVRETPPHGGVPVGRRRHEVETVLGADLVAPAGGGLGHDPRHPHQPRRPIGRRYRDGREARVARTGIGLTHAVPLVVAGAAAGFGAGRGRVRGTSSLPICLTASWIVAGSPGASQ